MRVRSCGWGVAVWLVVGASVVGAQDAGGLDDLTGDDGLGFLAEEAELTSAADTVSTAAGYAQRVDRTPSNVHIIDRAQIDAVNPRHPAEMLRFVPGFVVARRQEYSYELAVFGTGVGSSNKVLVLLDGHRVSDPGFGSTFYNSIPLAVDDVDRIEVVLGPESVQYDSGAFAAVVNFITRSPGDRDGQASVRVGGGGFDQVTVSADGGKEGSRTRVTAMQEHRRGPSGLSLLRGGQDATFNKADELSQKMFRIVHEADLSDDTQLRFTAGLVDSKSDQVPIGVVQQGGLLNSDQDGRHFTLDVSHRFAADRHLAFKTNYHRFNRDMSVPPLAALGQLETKLDSVQAESELRYRLRAGAWKLGVGAAHRRSDVSGIYVNPGPAQETTSFFLQGEREFGEKFVVFAGARAIQQNFAADDEISWKLAGLYRPEPSLGFRLSVGTSFRQPDLAGLRFVNTSRLGPFPLTGNFTSSNPNLENAVASGFLQAGVEKSWPDSRVKLDFYTADLEDFVSVGPAGPLLFTIPPPFPPIPPFPVGQGLQFQNVIGRRSVRGATLAYRRELKDEWTLTLSGHVQDLEQQGSGAQDVDAPPRAATLIVAKAPRGRALGGSLSWVAVDEHGVADGIRRTGAPNTVPGYGYVDLNLEKRLSSATRVGLTVHNLFDKEHAEMVAGLTGVPVTDRTMVYGREAYLTVRVDF